MLNIELLKKSENWILGDLNIDSLKTNHAHSSLLREFCRDNTVRDLTTGVTRPSFDGG